MQDEGNYAVSETEEEVTGLATLTRMTRFAGLYWVVVDCNWAVLGCAGLYWTVLGCNRL